MDPIQYIEVTKELARYRGITLDTDQRQMTTYKGALFRGVVLRHLKAHYGLSDRQAAKYFNITGRAVSYWSNRVLELLSINDPETKKLYRYLHPSKHVHEEIEVRVLDDVLDIISKQEHTTKGGDYERGYNDAVAEIWDLVDRYKSGW